MKLACKWVRLGNRWFEIEQGRGQGGSSCPRHCFVWPALTSGIFITALRAETTPLTGKGMEAIRRGEIIACMTNECLNQSSSPAGAYGLPCSLGRTLRQRMQREQRGDRWVSRWRESKGPWEGESVAADASAFPGHGSDPHLPSAPCFSSARVLWGPLWTPAVLLITYSQPKKGETLIFLHHLGEHLSELWCPIKQVPHSGLFTLWGLYLCERRWEPRVCTIITPWVKEEGNPMLTESLPALWFS